MNTSKSLLALLLLVLATAAFADDAVLLPITPSTINGAFDSRWHTVLFIWNGAPSAAALDCPPEACRAVPPQTEALFQANGSGQPGFVYIPEGSIETVAMGLRTFASTPDGVNTILEVPVVSTSKFRSDQVRILGVPIGKGYRQSLRIYDAEGRDGTQVRLQIFTGMSDPAVDGIVTLHVTTPQPAEGRIQRPAFAEIHNLLAAFPMLEQADFATIVVRPVDSDSHIWAFATSTNNLTQQNNNFLP
jgi:hypothetical protein